MADRISAILGPDAQPLRVGSEDHRGNGRTVTRKSFLSAVDQYMTALSQIRLPAQIRARDPFQNHAWVFAAAKVTVDTASQAPFLVFEEPDARRSPAAGSRRAAISRRSRKSVILRAMGAEPVYDHPIAKLLSTPNPYSYGNHLMQLTLLWLTLRGEAFWVLEYEDGNKIPSQLWPVTPDAFTPILSAGSVGELVAWRFQPPPWMPQAAQGSMLVLDLDDVIQFKFPNPTNPVRGMSRIGAAAESVQTDLKLRSYADRILDNQGVPKGVLEFAGEIPRDEEDAFVKKWEELHKGIENTGRVGILTGGFKYNPIALSPLDLQHLEQMRWDREEVLAVMGVPASIVLANAANYATSQSDRKNFWESTIIPLLKLIESTLEWTLFAPYTDGTFGMFDLVGVEALRVGVDEKVAISERLASERLHVPPRDAYTVVGLEVPEYDGEDKALVGGMSMTIDQVLNPPEQPPGFPGESPQAPAQEPPAPAKEPAPERARVSRAVRRRRSWREFVRLQSRVEAAMSRAYRGWVREVRGQVLKAFDQSTRGKGLHLKVDVRLEIILPKEKDVGGRLKAATRPVLAGGLETAYKMIVEEVGVPTFDIDDARIMEFFDVREQKLFNTVPRTLVKNLRAALQEGVQTGETVQAIRLRVARALDIAESSSRTLAFARTETAGFMNGARDTMFQAQGFEQHEWVTAGDEVVRDNHVVYGDAGPQDIGFNFMELSGGGGTLTYPGDVEGPASEVINCRCLAVPVS